MKKILLLGGSIQQIPAIEYANGQNYYTIVCDYLPNNPGQHFAKKYYCISTTDKEAILEIAIKEKIDGIVAYASDPAAPVAAYVAEKLKLPTNPYLSVEVLAFKDKFRKYLRDNRFNSPKSESFYSFEDALGKLDQFKFPLMVKPIDSSGSKGVSKIQNKSEFEKAFNLAINNSRIKKIILEEFIEKDHPYMIAGDCFVTNGKVEFLGLLNSHRNKKNNPFVPIGTSYPIVLNLKRLKLIEEEIQRLFKLLNIKFGAFNMEIMIDKNDFLYFIEIGPRNGGNMIPELLKYSTGINMIAATIETALGNTFNFELPNNHECYLSTYVIHTNKKGILKSLVYDDKVIKKIFKEVRYVHDGDEIGIFDGANKALGIIFLKFDSQKEQLEFMENPYKWINVILE
ncbi:ATP-grasp domain-containing protein [Solibacillus sp. FSL W7-1436]|uniref:ATP-grasp domain-containing protein n=1 Tax=Solibacillus sp. FSL W7-1436 TaxID=2921705 RepID=UPI0030F6735E